MYKCMGRNRMIKRTICGVLASVMLCTSVDVSVFAAENDRVEEIVDQSILVDEATEEPMRSEINDINEAEGIVEDNPFAGGSGTEDDPYLISSAEQMEKIVLNPNNCREPYYKLTTDLTLDDWSYLDRANAHFDGGNHTIHNLKITGFRGNRSGNYIALFGNIKSIKNLTIENAEINTDIVSSNQYGNVVSVFAGKVDIIENCCLKGNVLLKGERNAAGFCVYAQNIRKCDNYAQITVQNGDTDDIPHIDFGGFAYNVVNAKNLINKEGSSITCDGDVGGIFAYGNGGIIENCINYADIYTTDVNNLGDSRDAAGIGFRSRNCSLINCHNYGSINALGKGAAGIVWFSEQCTIKNCSNTGAVTTHKYNGNESSAAGIAREVEDGSTIEGCYNLGTITGYSVAGILNENDDQVHISSCYNKGELITSYEYNCQGEVGGIVNLLNSGKTMSVIENCYNSGKITLDGSGSIQAGGIVGKVCVWGYPADTELDDILIKIKNCYNNFSFEGLPQDTGNYTAGIVAEIGENKNGSKFRFSTENCYCLDKGYSVVNYSDYDRTDEYKAQVLAGIQQCTDAQMKKQETYEGFDFGSVWAMGEDDYPYPILIGSGGLHSGYEITLDPNGGTVSETVLYTNKTGKLISLPRAKKDGKHFLGWYSALESGDRITRDNVFEGDTTIYAHWGDYDESKKVTVNPQKPFNGERGVGFLSINPASGTNDAFDIEFRTYRHVREADFDAGAVRIYEYDAEGNLGHEPVFTLDKKNAKVTFNDNEEYENASYVAIHLGSSSGIGKVLGYNKKYSIEIDKEFLGFEDPECYLFVEKGDWNFTTGVVARFNDETNIEIRNGAEEVSYKAADVNLSYWFDPESLDFSKSSYEYDWNMAVFAYMTTLSAFESAVASYAIETGKQMDDYDGAANTRTFLVDRLGFEDFDYNDGYKNKPTTHSIGVCAANKKMVIGGKEYTLIVLPIRGAGYVSEWASNSNVGMGDNHAGFNEAAEQAVDFLEGYIEEKGISGKIKVLVTGYSRAGGTANLVAAKLDKKVEESGIVIKSATLQREDIYGYCFEPPATTKDSGRHNLGIYGNIHSFINQRDLIPMVPTETWGYGRYGKEYYYKNVDFSQEGNRGYHSELLKQYKKLAGRELKILGMFVNNKPVNASIWTSYVINGISKALGYTNFVDIQPVFEFLLKDGLGSPMGKAIEENLSELAGDVANEYNINTEYPLYSIINAFLFCLKYPEDTMDSLVRLNLSKWGLLEFLEEYNLMYGATDTAYLIEKSTPKIRQKKILESIGDTLSTSIIGQEHDPLLNFAWLLYYKNGELSADGAHYKKVYVKCPVDVEVYDEENRLAATIINNEANVVDNNEGRPVDIVAYVDQNEQKIIIYPEDRNYSIRIKATGSGTMDISEEDYAVGEGVTKRMDYLDIPIEAGTQLSGAENADGDIVISKDGSVLTPEVHTDIVKYNVNLTVEGNGYTIGSGEYTQHDYVAANAVSYPDTVFEGWYEGDMLVSEDAEYRFRVEKDIELTARFKTIDGIRISSIEPQEYTGYVITPDIMLYDGSQELTQGADYTVSYKNNKNAFTFEDEDKLTDAQKKKAPQATIKMKGSYTGQKTVYFNIEPLKIDDGSLFEASLKPGKALKAVFKYNGKALKENRDYKVDAINSGSVTITGTGNFTGTCTFPLKGGTELTVVPISKAIADPIPVQYYTGVELTGDTFKMGPDGDTKYEFRICYPKGVELKKGADYEIAKVINGRKPGTGTVVIRGLRADGTGEGSTKYSFTGERYLKFKIAPRSIELAEVTSSGDMFAVPYNKAGAKIPGLTVTVNGTALKEGRDYTVKYSKNTAFVGTSTTSGSDPVAVITGKGNYKDTKKVNFTIVKREFSTVSGITVVAPDRPEGKKAGDYATAVKVFDSEGKLLKAGTDYEKDVKYFTSDGNEASKDIYPKAGDILTVKVTGRGGYLDGTIEASYKILNKGETNDISKASIKIDQLSFGNVPATLDGNNAGKVHAAIGKDKKALTFSTDGTSGDLMVLPGSYVNNDRKGTASVTLIGINGYSGCKTVKFKVGARSLAEWWKGLFK